MAHTALPFLKPPDQLPCPLPNEREITEGTLLCGDTSNQCVVAVGEHFVVKYGRRISEVEGQNLLFLEQKTGAYLTAPKLYAMWRMASTGHICLVMQRLPGESLETLWPQLTEEDKSAVCARLKKAFNFLRQLPSPGFYGGIGKTPLPPTFSGIRPKTQQFADLSSKENRGYMDHKIGFYERHLDVALSGHDSVFSHSDLQRKNILVHRHAGTIISVAIVDWKYAGWYPSYWEYCLGFSTALWVDDWPKRLEDIIAPWPRETAVFRMLYQELYF
ncbi:hypothetical protein CC80DRAFT_589899 [Byssothecium circinans]|uniref:Aminoglycoside phosphotransferase domain-containing protein n=1 Tax=Byssothecium circinans TaxID=147558 RepID=A0A6A5U714_9PLEO|nr:hypothetical protein CC80DRAFT_589899 [Byssothecium circinans]